jgi:hypothetical protein
MKIEKLIFNLIFGAIIPIFCFLCFWWGSLLFTYEKKEVIIAAFTGLCIGIVITILIIVFCKLDVFLLSKPILIIAYIFYSICVFGFFMGVPIFNVALGIFAGYYCAKRIINNDRQQKYKSIKQFCFNKIKSVPIFTSIIIGLISIASAIIALSSESTPLDLKHMLNLPFDITHVLLILIIIFGGLLLIFAQYYITIFTIKKTLEINKYKSTGIL